MTGTSPACIKMILIITYAALVIRMPSLETPIFCNRKHTNLSCRNRPPTCRLPGKQSFLDARQNTGMVSLYLSFQKYNNNNNNNNNSSHEINSGCEINLGLHGKDGTQGDPPCMNHEYYYALQVQV